MKLPYSGSRHLRLLALLMLAPAGALHATDLQVYGGLPAIEEVALSPQGTRLAVVRTTGDARLVTVLAMADHKTVGALRMHDQKLRGLQWADEDHLLVWTSVTGLPWGFAGEDQELAQLQVFDVAHGRTHSIPSDREHDDHREVLNTLWGPVDVRQVAGRTILFVRGSYLEDLPASFGVKYTYPMLMRVDLDTGREELERLGSEKTRDWVVDNQGEIAAEQEYDEDHQRWSLKVRRDGQLREIAAGQAAIDAPRLLGLGPRDGTVVLRMLEQGEPVWKLVDLADGKIGAALEAGGSLDAPIVDEQSHRLAGGTRVEDSVRYVFFDPAQQRRWDAIAHAFPGEHLHLVSTSNDWHKVVVRVDGTHSGLRYVLVDLQARKASPVGTVYAEDVQPFETRRIDYEARDHLRIPAYLTLPQGAATGLPLVVMPHGGPAARDTADFDWWSQALASEGYAVLRPNFRGSTLGQSFLEAGYGEFGRKMQTDLSDGVRYLAEQGIIDPARVCIVGASYGGYAALAGVTLQPEVYRCAVAVAGISDPSAFLRNLQERERSQSSRTQRFWERFMGVQGPQDPALAGISPLHNLQGLHAPVLLIHGQDDTVVPYSQSQELYNALSTAHKPVELVRLTDEDHWLSRTKTRQQMLLATVTFLRANNPVAKPPAPTGAATPPAR